MANKIINADQASEFLKCVSKHPTASAGVVSQVIEEATRREHGIKRAAAEIGVLHPYLQQMVSGSRDLPCRDVELLARIGKYLGVDLGVMQIAVGNLHSADFVTTSSHTTCEVVSEEVRAWLDSEYARNLHHLCVAFEYSQSVTPSAHVLPIEQATEWVPPDAWDALESSMKTVLQHDKLLQWVFSVGRSGQFKPPVFFKHLGLPGLRTHQLVTGMMYTTWLPPAVISRIAALLGIPAAAAMYAAGVLTLDK